MIKLPKTFKSKKSFEKWLDKNHKKLRDSVFTNPVVSDIHYLVYYVEDNVPFCRFISAFNNSADSHYYLRSTTFDCWGKLNGKSVKEFLEEDFNIVSDAMVQKYESLVRDDFVYNVTSGSYRHFDESCEYTIIDYRTDAQVLDYFQYLECDITEYNNGKYKYVPTINERFAYLIDRFDCTYKNEKDYVKTLDIRDKAIFYGANPEFDVFNKEWIKDEFGHWIVSYDNSFTKKQAREIYDYVKREIEAKKFELRCEQERAKQGYSMLDVWNFNSWFTETMSNMLKDLAKNTHGYPIKIYEQYFERNKDKLYTQDYEEWLLGAKNKKQEKQKEKADNECAKEWNNILNHMSYLLNELDEDRCSWNIKLHALEEKWRNLREKFEEEYGNGDSLKTEEEKKWEKENNCYFHVGPDRHPNKDFVNNYKEAMSDLFKFRRELSEYQDKCKNEFFDLMKEWFWDLWD